MSDEKIKSILEATEPGNIAQLRSFLGMTSFYHRHIPGPSMQSPRVHELLNKGSTWQWSEKHRQKFSNLKRQLQTAYTLQPENPNAEIIIMTDASPDGVGAVLLNRKNGQLATTACVSATLSSADPDMHNLSGKC